MAPRRWLNDVIVAEAALCATIVILTARGFGTPGPTARELDVQGWALAVLTAVPLAFRRDWPAWAFGLSVLGSLALLRQGYPLDVPVGAGVAAYCLSVTYSGAPPRERLAALIAVNGFVPLVMLAYASAGINPLTILGEMTFWGAVFTGLWIAGDRTRLRQARLAEAMAETRWIRVLAEIESQRIREESDLRDRRMRAEAERDRRLAAADERIRIARELHDSAGHAINVILVQAGAARLLQQRDPERACRALDTIETVARDTIADIDRMVRAMRDDRDGDVPADPGALGELIARHRASGLSIDAELPEPSTPMPRSVAWAAYRILQEALTNASRHGSGSAEVSVRFAGSRVEIDVTNPTTTHPPHTTATRTGLGIVGMRERATLLGGTLRAEPANDRFRLYAVLPHT